MTDQDFYVLRCACGRTIEVKYPPGAGFTFTCGFCTSPAGKRKRTIAAKAAETCERVTLFKQKVEEFALLPLNGNEECWFCFAKDEVKADPAHIESLVEVIHNGKWRKSRSPRKYLAVTSAREHAKKAKDLGQLPKADIFNHYWDAADGTTRLMRDPNDTEKPACCFEYKAGGLAWGDNGVVETQARDAFEQQIGDGGEYRQKTTGLGWKPDREDIENQSFWEQVLTTLDQADWDYLCDTHLHDWDDDERRCLWLRTIACPLEQYIRERTADEQKRLRAADRRMRRKWEDLRKELRKICSMRRHYYPLPESIRASYRSLNHQRREQQERTSRAYKDMGDADWMRTEAWAIYNNSLTVAYNPRKELRERQSYSPGQSTGGADRAKGNPALYDLGNGNSPFRVTGRAPGAHRDGSCIYRVAPI
ncbi:MAG: hypothetical protein ABSG91_18950 [Syntrophobacteraceae bacterium]